MFRIFEDAMNDTGFTGFFLPHPNGGFTIHLEGAWVTGDLLSREATISTDEVAPSALIQAFQKGIDMHINGKRQTISRIG